WRPTASRARGRWQTGKRGGDAAGRTTMGGGGLDGVYLLPPVRTGPARRRGSASARYHRPPGTYGTRQHCGGGPRVHTQCSPGREYESRSAIAALTSTLALRKSARSAVSSSSMTRGGRAVCVRTVAIMAGLL